MSDPDNFQCGDCRAVFERAEANQIMIHTPVEYWGHKSIHNEVMLACPMCGSDDVAEHEEESDDDNN